MTKINLNCRYSHQTINALNRLRKANRPYPKGIKGESETVLFSSNNVIQERSYLYDIVTACIH